VYVVPLVNPVTDIGLEEPEAVMFPGEEVTIYEFTVGPVVGGVNEIDATVEFVWVAETDVGGFGRGINDIQDVPLYIIKVFTVVSKYKSPFDGDPGLFAVVPRPTWPFAAV